VGSGHKQTSNHAQCSSAVAGFTQACPKKLSKVIDHSGSNN